MCKSNIIKLISLTSIIIVSSSFLLTGCFDKKEENQTNNSNNIIEYVEKKPETDNVKEKQSEVSLYKEYNFNFDENNAFSKVENFTELNSDTQISIENAKKIYNIEDKDNYSISLRSTIKNNNAQDGNAEIAIIRVPNTNENVSAIKAVSDRIKQIKDITRFGEEPYVIEQTKGVLTVVICKNAREVSNLLTEKLKIEE